MSDNFLQSSDSVRSAKPLKYLQIATFEGPIKLESGNKLPNVTVAYETYGRLTPERDNAVLICHALSGDSHVAAHDDQDEPGWWDIAIGPGKAIDTDEYFVICPNVLGGCRGTTGPNSINPTTQRPYGQDFPTITIGDMVDLQRRLIDHVGIDKLLAIVGGSMGGHQVLSWAVKYPEIVGSVVAIATSPRLTSQALAFDIVGRNAIIQDPNFHGGEYYDKPDKPDVGLAIARMIGHVTYLSREAMKQKFGSDRLSPRDVPTSFEKTFSVGSYLGYKGTQFVDRFDANSYMTLSMAMDLFDLGETTEQLAERFAPSQAEWLTISISSDWLFPPDQSEQIVDALIAANKPVTYCNVVNACGHDGFLLESNIESFGGLIGAFLANRNGQTGLPDTIHADHGPSPTSIFNERLDYEMILELIATPASVLDLGCGKGDLLLRLRERGCRRILGLERDQQAILACTRRGLSVIHADLNDGLGQFHDGQFEYVVLSRTLQAVMNVEKVIADMLRVGRRCIVSFPNFGYHKLRAMLGEQGRAPKSTGQLHYEWYNTPNIRFLTIADFDEFCEERGITVHRRMCLNTESNSEVEDQPNLNADMAIFVISG